MARPLVGASPTAVFLIDLDSFKSINDRFGHAVGDHVLQIFAETAKNTLRQCDLVGRLGGEEFAAMLPNVNRDKAVALAEQIRTAFAQATIEVDGYPTEAALSIGVALNLGGALDVSGLLAQADEALYYAKERGRNRVEVATAEITLHRKGAVAPRLLSAKTAA
jgi:diguanylate cyclase (GGDEF)-like protein